jgi:hypothetical protein
MEKEIVSNLPRTLTEFLRSEQPEDRFKYEWNDSELIRFTGLNKKQIGVYNLPNK